MSHESPKIPNSPPTKEQALADLTVMEGLLSQAEEMKDKLLKAIESGDTEKQKELSLKIKETLSQCRSLKRKIEGKSSTTLEVEYKHIEETKDEKTGKTTTEEKKETITIDIEKEIEYFTSFYTTHSIDRPKDFSETMKNIWERNIDQIREEIEKHGFDTILLIPETLPNLTDLNAKMSEGYNETYTGSNFNSGGGFEGVIEDKKRRIVLVHSQELWQQSELKQTLNKKIETFLSLPPNQSLTLSDYLILQRKIFEQTGKHIDTKNEKDGLYYWTALPGSKVPNPDKTAPSSFRVVCAHWYPDGSQLNVVANDPSISNPPLGGRLSRSFL